MELVDTHGLGPCGESLGGSSPLSPTSTQMKKKKMKLSKGIRKYIRQEKARIRREILDIGKQDKLIEELYKKFHK